MQENKEEPETEQYITDVYENAASCAKLKKSATGVLYDDYMSLHKCEWDSNYPEKPERYTAVVERCFELGLLKRCVRLNYTIPKEESITKLHTKELYDKLKDISNKVDIAGVEKDASNYDAIYFNKSTFDAALISAGCAIALVEGVCEGTVQNGMAIIRPPGHHAMAENYCGYCYFNNVAIAAQHALDNQLAKRILILDWDVHHGQGTQQLFYSDPRVLYISIHRYEQGTFWPNLPESNFNYIGEKDGTGYNINIPLNVTGLEDKDYMAIVHNIVLPVAYEFQPNLIIISAGYDACLGCPEGEMEITPAFYGHLITLLSGLAMGKIAVCLEGGYFLPSLAEGAAMTLKSLLGDPIAPLQNMTAVHDSVIDTINNIVITLHKYWNCFKYYKTYTGDLGTHEAIVQYKGVPPEAPFLTRNCYPVVSLPNIIKYNKILMKLQNSYRMLGTNQTVVYSYDEKMLLHDSDHHAETSQRLKATYSLFKEWGLDKRCLKAEPCADVWPSIERVHSPAYIKNIHTLSFWDVIPSTDGDMYYSDKTPLSIYAAVDCLLAVVETVMLKKAMSGVAIIRPPGHHADFDRPSGFCYVNNIAIAAQHLLDKFDVKKILIMDFDVHHGNGTQNLFYNNNSVLYISIHKYDDGTFFPKSLEGNLDRCGSGNGEGFNVNIPINNDILGNIDYLTLFHRIVLPIAYSYNPEVVLVSAGFDAGINDTLANYRVTPDCFGQLIQLLKPLAGSKLILALEGGYNVSTIKYSMNVCIKTLLGDPLPMLQLDPNSVAPGLPDTIDKVIDIQKKYWPILKVSKKIKVGEPVQELDTKLKDTMLSS